ncbi:type 1 fimbriae anchoring protein FimD [Klebsiella pneumoniae subsp. rhinoscleromatis]|nr:type 1 fimbriae anchoring protein FimD [Klebsiella pneumoniae subsp. rhinoscleromatis]
MKRITTARVREYALLPVTAGRAVALATVPTMMFCLSPLSRAMADDYFDPAALEFADPQQQTSDLHYFAKPGGQQPGTYPVTVVVNDQELGQDDITFVDDGGQLRPVLTPGQLAEYGVNVSAFPAFQALHEGETFTRIEKFIPDASSRFSFANQRLTLSIPQAAMNVQSRGYVDPFALGRWRAGRVCRLLFFRRANKERRRRGEQPLKLSQFTQRPQPGRLATAQHLLNAV